MTACNFRSLLLAAIVLSNCVTWTASRHHYTHNVHQHRTRHRRQGAGLFLSASYVIPGGEGAGWGEWGEVSPCSRTCGGGVASQKRICLQIGPDGQPQCSGGDTKYFSCQTQDCPSGALDFRSEQCAEFDNQDFRGYKYNWVPYTKAPNPCELNCMPHGERFYFRHKAKVTDGTRCNDESFDVCVDGQCQPVGCDMMLGSNAREDKCRECRGNGANCRTTGGIFDSQDLMKGYNDILLIPEGSTSIIIEEIEPSNNYLALRAKNGTYYLNGHYHIDFPRSIMIAGALWTYERSQQGFAAPDKLRCLGPTNELLYVSLLLQDVNVGIKYEYSIPIDSAPPTDKRYNWVHEAFTPCSATCGGGFQTRNVTCRSREELELVDEGLCDEGLKPPTNQSCNPDPCPAQWVEGAWGNCSKRCGSGGVKSREVTCQKIIANGQTSLVPDKECFDLLGPKPELFQECNQDAPCPTWFIGHWKPCDKLCDEGIQKRDVICHQKKNGRIEILPDEECTEKPEAEQPCYLQPCDGVDWVAAPWIGCDTCVSKVRTRVVKCVTKGQKILNDSFCSYHTRPVDQEECDKVPPCEVQWYATQWSKCSVECGEGVQTRKIFCGLYDGENVSVVEDAKCADLEKYNDTKPCSVPLDKCPSQWFAGPWTACSKECDTGEQHRRVMCLRGNEEATDCNATEIPDPSQFCNTQPCNKDEVTPVDSKSTPIMDNDDEECEDYDTDYAELGLEEDPLSGTTMDLMMSDSTGTGYAEFESTLTTETGSGDGFEGSGGTVSDYTTETDLSSATDDSSTIGVIGSSTTISTTETDKTTVDKHETTKTTVSSSKGSTSSGETERTSSTSTDETTDVSGSTSSGDTEETTTEETGSTPTGGTGSTSLDETGSTGTSESGSTESSTSISGLIDSGSTVSGSSDLSSTKSGSTKSTISTDETGSTKSTVSSESTVTKETGSTKSTITEETGSTESTITEKTGSTESTITEKTGSSESTITEKTGSTESTITEETGSTESTITEETGSTESTITEETGSTDTTMTEETGSTESTITEETGSTKSTITEETGSTESTITEKTGSTESTITEKTGSTESTITEETGSTESTITEKTGSTKSTITKETGSTESTITEKTGSTESTITEETGSTESTITEKTGSTKSTITEETVSTESTITEETGSTESTITEKTGSTKSTITEETVSTESTITEKTGSTESTITEETVSTESTITESSTTNTGSTETEETSSSSSTEGSDSTTEKTTVDKDETTKTTVSESSSSSATTDFTGSTVSTVETSTTSSESGSTESSTSESESTVSSTSESSTSESGSTESSIGSESTSVETSSGPTESTEVTVTLVSTSEATETSGSEATESNTASGSTVESTESSTSSESTTQSVSTTEGFSTSSGETELTSTEVSTSTEEGSTTESGSTEESTTSFSTTEVSGSTLEGLSTTESSTTEGVSISSGRTIWDFSSTIGHKNPFCKPRKPTCSKTEFGCCPDKRTIAAGPFDEGCLKPHTCKESLYGCCPDGLSAALGTNNEGCPIEPCADTLFGCCLSDNKTAAQGNDQDGCPPPPPACVSSEYGCCADNQTEAAGPEKEGCPETETTTTEMETETTETETTESSGTTEETTSSDTSTTESSTEPSCAGSTYGCCFDNETAAIGPDGEGCPCDTTEFGCCPDGVSPAQGVEQEGCPGPCSTSPYGCCQDDKTPAHGPDFEGCCLLAAYGCCPDNRKPAEGPHLEGCGCQYAIHGCCPNNITIAQGPDNQGCGCQYTQHGCCPDRHTEATGPKNEGCSCHTYQFGCCPDGITIAKGPEQQGCHCRNSKFGCCGDEETPASGPDAAGCDCSSSKYGCCPDGQTEATGAKFLGCTDAPVNKQAACSMSTDPGPCHNFTAMWFYDLTYGGCSRFWYGGCEGNGNRFATKEECEDICVQPPPKDACKLPSVKGPCDADYVRWHYNSSREQCIPFRYGGCLGNANNFDTRELCKAQCEPDKSADQCTLPIEQGTCAGNFSRWGFNAKAHRCEQFTWGGCEGNSNRFSTETACQLRCDPPGALKPQCTEPQDAGNCTEKEALWSFSQSENRCVPFYYSGCGGNDNRFTSREACEQSCPSAYVPDKCTLPAETGECANYREKWFYDTGIKRCRQFYYGGCGGNENNFATEAECANSCTEISLTTTTIRPTQPQPQTRPPQQPAQEPERAEFCFLSIDAGPCTSMETRYAYDSDLGRCTTFEYGGCGGNQNNFPSEEYCTYYCHPVQDICQLPMLEGPCNDSQMRWFYDPSSDSCSQFTYGGCEGNDNRFESREACESRCRSSPAQTTVRTTVTTPAPTTPAAVEVRLPAECRLSEALEECSYSGIVWYYDADAHECVSYRNENSGSDCRYTGTFNSPEACERSCGAFRGIDVCRQPVDPGPCRANVPKIYFDEASGECRQFEFGGCLGGPNRFSSVDECTSICKRQTGETDICQLPPEQGNCISSLEQWYYDASRDQCSRFIYTGCSGNANRFDTQQDCEARCKRPSITTTVPPQQPTEAECTTPSSLAPCGANLTTFYYDSARHECLVGDIGGCGLPNSYASEEECERRCGAFRGVDVCGTPLDPGPCRASFTKFYWDALSASCQPYAYGGCAGGPNRFSTLEECQNVCGTSGPARRCLLEVDTGAACGAAVARRWHYSARHADCVVFMYLGCGGNDNNFRSYSECINDCTTRGDGNEVVPADCEMLRNECDALFCQYGIERVLEDGCQRCKCIEDPCVTANCSPSERCVTIALRDPSSSEPQYSARCVPDHETNEVLDCEAYVQECSSLQCEYGVQRRRTADGCERCACVAVEIDCAPLADECARLKCNYGMDNTVGADGCERCKCKEHPCENHSCASDERCAVTVYRDAVDQEAKYSAECRTIVKAGTCPVEDAPSDDVCRRECNDDADCRGAGKCCRRGCSQLCAAPADPTAPHALLTTTYAPDVPAAPQALPQAEPDVAASVGGRATLRCLFHGNPPPKITWRRGELTIDGSVGRYRLTSEGSLEIVSLYRNDTGVYICVADNGLGVARQEIHLVVNDPERVPVGIAGDENAVVTGELGQPLLVRCLAYGFPAPTVFWYRGLEGTMVPYNDAIYEARGNVLLIRSLSIDTLGEYTCQAYNGEGKPASWVVAVRAYRPDSIFVENEFLVPRYEAPPAIRTLPPTTRETTTTTTTTTEAPVPLFTVPVNTHVSTPFSTLNIGAELRLTCEVDGFPDPDVYWTKDGAPIQPDERISISGSTIVSRLAVQRVSVADSGVYACHASNAYSSHSDTTQINVQQLVVPAKCTDNPFFANCDLIVRSRFCRHKYYSKFCCKSCVEAGQLDPQEAELQADQPFRRK